MNIIDMALGSVRSVLDANHLPLETIHYTPYGAGSPTESLHGFTGEPTDANGLVHLRARYYDPALGVFPSLDPVEFVNRYSYVSGSPVNATDPSGLCAGFLVPCSAALAVPFGLPIGVEDVAACSPFVLCMLAASYTLTQIAEEIADNADVALAEAQRIVEEAFGQDTAPDTEPDPFPERRPWPIPIPRPDDDDESCPTNFPPGSTAQFDLSREMEDVMCNIKKYTAPTGPQPNSWWNSLQGRVNPIFGDLWQGTQAAFIGRDPANPRAGYREFTTYRFYPLRDNLRSMFIPRPGQYSTTPARTRADIMTFVIHELRHAGQFYSLFSQEQIRGTSLRCSNISGRIAEVDAWRATNHWVVHSIQSGRLSRTDLQDGDVYLNNGNMWTVDGLWNHSHITIYREIYGEDLFNNAPYFACPNSASASIYPLASIGLSC